LLIGPNLAITMHRSAWAPGAHRTVGAIGRIIRRESRTMHHFISSPRSRRPEMLHEPPARQAGRLLPRPRLLEQMPRTRHDRQFLLAAQSLQRLAVHSDHDPILAADDQQCRGIVQPLRKYDFDPTNKKNSGKPQPTGIHLCVRRVDGYAVHASNPRQQRR